MPDLTAAQIQSDLAAIMGALPGATVTATINGNSYSLLLAPEGVANQETMAAGLSPGRTRQAVLTRAGLGANDHPVAMQTTITIATVEWRVIAVNADPFSAAYILTIAPPDYYTSQ